MTSARLMFNPNRRNASHVSKSCPSTFPKDTVTTVASGSAVLSMSTTGMPWSESFITSSMDAVARGARGAIRGVENSLRV